MTELSLGAQLDRALKQFEIAKAELVRVRELIIGVNIISNFSISKRETEVLDGVQRGLSNKEIASELFICVRTVKFHITSLLSKTGCNDRLELKRILNENEAKSAIPILPIRAPSRRSA